MPYYVLSEQLRDQLRDFLDEATRVCGRWDDSDLAGLSADALALFAALDETSLIERSSLSAHVARLHELDEFLAGWSGMGNDLYTLRDDVRAQVRASLELFGGHRVVAGASQTLLDVANVLDRWQQAGVISQQEMIDELASVIAQYPAAAAERAALDEIAQAADAVVNPKTERDALDAYAGARELKRRVDKLHALRSEQRGTGGNSARLRVEYSRARGDLS